MEFSSLQRTESYQQMKQAPLDVLIIGGGITGAGIALDASARGVRAGVLEMQDFAAGTSSRSTKLVHGGLRYLKQFEVKMVAEVGKEREIVYENGPHVTTPEWMMLPFHKGGTFGPISTNVGLRVYDFLAGVKKGERRRMLSRDEVLKLEPLVKQQGLKGAGYYVEYKTDDARLTMEVMKKAVEKGTFALNYVKVKGFLYDNGKAVGVVAEDQLDGTIHEIFAKKIVNAAGPWVDTLREEDKSKNGKTLQLTKGIHLVFDQSHFPLRQAIYFDMPDGRMAFAIPRQGKVYVGTTDTVYEQDIAHPTMTREDRDYVLEAVNFMFPEVAVSADDVESSWAGLRPLIHEEGKDPSEISRKDEIFVSDSGLISIAGGKLTGYRKMGENIIDLVTKQLQDEYGTSFKKVSTKKMALSGGEVGGSIGFKAFKADHLKRSAEYGLTEDAMELLVNRYGANVDHVLRFYTEGLADASDHNLDPLVYAMLRYGIDAEAVCKPADFFIRRTGALYFDIDWVRAHKGAAADYMAGVFSWNSQQQARYMEELDILLHEAVTPIAVSELSK